MKSELSVSWSAHLDEPLRQGKHGRGRTVLPDASSSDCLIQSYKQLHLILLNDEATKNGFRVKFTLNTPKWVPEGGEKCVTA